MLLLYLDHDQKTPLFKQIFNRIKAMIDENTLKPGDKLPSTRVLVFKLDVHRTTVVKAYEELWARGYTESSPGSYTTVRKRVHPVLPRREQRKEIVNWDKICTAESRALIDSTGRHKAGKAGENRIDFFSLSPDPALMPVDDFKSCITGILRTNGRDMLGYGDPQGYGPLRESIADQMRRHGILLSADEILITNGTQNAIELIFKLICNARSKGGYDGLSVSLLCLIIYLLCCLHVLDLPTDTGESSGHCQSNSGIIHGFLRQPARNGAYR